MNSSGHIANVIQMSIAAQRGRGQRQFETQTGGAASAHLFSFPNGQIENEAQSADAVRRGADHEGIETQFCSVGSATRLTLVDQAQDETQKTYVGPKSRGHRGSEAQNEIAAHRGAGQLDGESHGYLACAARSFAFLDGQSAIDAQSKSAVQHLRGHRRIETRSCNAAQPCGADQRQPETQWPVVDAAKTFTSADQVRYEAQVRTVGHISHGHVFTENHVKPAARPTAGAASVLMKPKRSLPLPPNQGETR